MLILFTSLFMSYQLRAQDDFSIGPRAGVNFSNVSNVDGSESLTGAVFGLTSTYSINETVGLTMDALYSREGYRTGINDVKFAYLQIPLYFDVFFGELGERFRPKIYAGVVPGFLLDVNVNDEDADSDQFDAANFALSGGLGFNYRMASRIWLNTDLRAYQGLNDIRAGDAPEGDKVMHNNVQLSLGLAYGLVRWE
jgi:outer membrane protein W